MAERNTVMFRNAEIIFRNFAGKEGQYNKEGDRNFCLILDQELAAQMDADGWNVKHLKPREDGALPTPYLQISVGFKIRPPRVIVVTSVGRVDVSEEEMELLDWVDIKNVDLVIRPYHWGPIGPEKKTGTKAYLKSLFITIDEDPLEIEYNKIPEIGGGVAAIEHNNPLAIESGQTPNDADDIVDGEIIEEGF